MANRGTVQRPNGSTQGKICQFKLVLLGESAVGKSSLVLRFVKGQFHEYQESTIGGKEFFFYPNRVLLSPPYLLTQCNLRSRKKFIIFSLSKIKAATCNDTAGRDSVLFTRDE